MTTVAVPTVFWDREPARLLAAMLSTGEFDLGHSNAFEEFEIKELGEAHRALNRRLCAIRRGLYTHF